MSELLQCPFCGGRAEYTDEDDLIGIYCRNCNAAMFHSAAWIGKDYKCAASWNKRVDDLLRCDRCEYYSDEIPQGLGFCSYWKGVVEFDGYCTWGKRK